jgi:hypothetical protein
MSWFCEADDLLSCVTQRSQRKTLRTLRLNHQRNLLRSAYILGKNSQFSIVFARTKLILIVANSLEGYLIKKSSTKCNPAAAAA